MRSDCAGVGVLTFLIGVAVGAGVALLTAPQSGQRTRRQIARKAEDAQAYLEDLGEELVDRGRELVDRARSGVEQKIKEVTT
ncbi:MAG TPA: YtxH domain-containing protein [Bryobacterales bacterium]|nr:YtxH domain-containing protein [Bryobacterales bacterium]